eukprot:3241440-Prymnesium_polylepis.1
MDRSGTALSARWRPWRRAKAEKKVQPACWRCLERSGTWQLVAWHDHGQRVLHAQGCFGI